MIKIITIEENSPYLSQVIKLGDANSKTLGFLPQEAFHNFAECKQILIALDEVAVDEKDKVLGYLLYHKTQRQEARLVHLCVENSHRHKGVAKLLFDELKNKTKELFGIRVHCRRDYKEASELWRKLGFIPRDEKPGRSKKGSTLTIWWFNHGHPDLFTLADEQRASSKFKVVIDANIFYDLLQKSPNSASEKESHSLLADWLNIELCLTEEIYNEIDRSEDKTKRQYGRKSADTFTKLVGADDEFQKYYKQLCHLFGRKNRDSDQSDLRQLARSIAAGVPFFITQDEALLKIDEKIYKEFGMHIITPSRLIIHQDELMRETEYQPVRLAGQITIKRVDSEEIPGLEKIFYLSSKETKSKFKRLLRSCLTDPHQFDIRVVQRTGKPVALVVHRRYQPRELDIPLFRVVQDSLAATLARHLVMKSILDFSPEDILLKVTDPHLSEEIIDALQENGFVWIENAWLKVRLPVIETVKELASRLTTLSNEFPQANQYCQKMVEALNQAQANNYRQILLGIEKALWPAKITDLEIPALVVPIWPEWAMQLFDFSLEKQDLFGGNPNLIFSAENVYYRATGPSPKELSAPARLLWYVSEGKGPKDRYQGIKSIRACSYLDEIVIDKPKALFSRFKRLGVYRWENLLETANQNPDQDIMALRFSHTEIFRHPISIEELKDLWRKETGKNFHIQMPISISSQLFGYLYQKGLQTQSSR